MKFTCRDAGVTDTAGQPGFTRQLRHASGAQGFAPLTGSYLLQMTACSVLASALPYLVTRNLGRAESDIGLALGALMGASVLTPPLWGWLGSRYGERRILIAAMGAFALACLAAAAAVAFHLPWYLSLGTFACAGVAFCGLQVVPFTLLAHLAHAERQRVGASAEATITGLWTATEKLGLALPCRSAARRCWSSHRVQSPLDSKQLVTRSAKVLFG